MEYIDIYTENGEMIGKEDRSVVHRDALWHKTVHCWLYDKCENPQAAGRQQIQILRFFHF